MSQKNKIKNSLPVQGRSKLLRGTTLIHRMPGGLLPLGSSCNGNGPARSSRAARKWRCAGLGQGALTASPLAWAAMAHGLPHRQISYRFFILSRIFPLSRAPGWKFSLGALPSSLSRGPGSAVRRRAFWCLSSFPQRREHRIPLFQAKHLLGVRQGLIHAGEHIPDVLLGDDCCGLKPIGFGVDQGPGGEYLPG